MKELMLTEDGILCSIACGTENHIELVSNPT